MPTKPNKNLDILNRRQQVAQLYLQNWTQIADRRASGRPPADCERGPQANSPVVA